MGTVLYQSPEILTQTVASPRITYEVEATCDTSNRTGYDNRTDIWSFGCIVYQLCNFEVPFSALNEKRLIEKIKTMSHKQMGSGGDKVTQELRDLCEICLNKDYRTRPTARELLNLDMIQQWAKDLNMMS